MNREIKFRAWDEQQNRFLRPSEIFSRMLIDDESGVFFVGGIIGRDWHEPKLMQYTGLKDKNGVDIYEGDIVKSKIFGICEVRYESNAFVLWDKSSYTRDYKNFLYDNVEVIGNIYENPELLN